MTSKRVLINFSKSVRDILSSKSSAMDRENQICNAAFELYDSNVSSSSFGYERAPAIDDEMVCGIICQSTFGLVSSFVEPLLGALGVGDEVMGGAISIDPFTQKSLDSAELIAGWVAIDSVENFEWSAPIILICKGFEFELIKRIFEPLREISSLSALSDDMKDKDIGKIAKFCAIKGQQSPELGVVAHFLSTAIHSKSRRLSSVLLSAFFLLVERMADPKYVVGPQNLLHAVQELTRKYRNPSAHTATMSRNDYQACSDLIADPGVGALYRLIGATRWA